VSPERDTEDAWELSGKHDKLARRFVTKFLYGSIKTRKHRYSAPWWVHEPAQGIDMVELREDLHSVAVIAQQKAARSWNPALGIKFSTYAADPVGQALTEEIDRHRRIDEHTDEAGNPLEPVSDVPFESFGIPSSNSGGASAATPRRTPTAVLADDTYGSEEANGDDSRPTASELPPRSDTPASVLDARLGAGSDQVSGGKLDSYTPLQFAAWLRSTPPSPQTHEEAAAYIERLARRNERREYNHALQIVARAGMKVARSDGDEEMYAKAKRIYHEIDYDMRRRTSGTGKT
jgi:hypothetical protein